VPFENYMQIIMSYLLGEDWKKGGGKERGYRPVEVATALGSLAVCRLERLCAPGTPAGAFGIYRLSI
jgi:hypothetical protein